MSANTKRIARELELFQKNAQTNINKIYVTSVNDNLLDLRGLIIAPNDTPYQGCFLYFSITPENYPYSPPKMKFLTPFSSDCRIHPNLYADGKICLSILGTWGSQEWSPFLTFEKVLITIQGLLSENPITHEPSYENTHLSQKRATDYAVQSRWLSLLCVKHTLLNKHILPEEFQTVVQEYFDTNKEVYLKSIDLLKPYDREQIHTIHGHHTVDIESILPFFS
jgi:ubiquitin-protein ligase